MPFICLRRTDIPDGYLQVTDLWPNKSRVNPTQGPKPQGPRYLSAPVAGSFVTNYDADLDEDYYATAQSGLGPYLYVNLYTQDSGGQGGSPLKEDAVTTLVSELLSTMRAGGEMDLPEIFEAVAETAINDLNFQQDAANGSTVTIDGKVYTFQTVLTNVDGNVAIGGTAAASLANLVAAITLGAGAGTAYAAATTLHPTVTAVMGVGDVMNASAKEPGAAGNEIEASTTVQNAFWGTPFFEGGENVSAPTAAQTKDILRILSGITYTVPAGTVFGVSGSFVAQAASFNVSCFASMADLVPSDSGLAISVAEGQLAVLASSAFSYLGTAGAAVVVYDDSGAVL